MPEATPSARSLPLWPLLLVPLAFSAATRDLWAPDEPRYAEIAREIVEGADRGGPLGGDWVVMHLCGAVYPDKPPLLYWLAALLGAATGWSVAAMRCVSIAATALSAWLVRVLARRWWGEREAALAPLVFLTMGEVAWHGARLQIDPLLAAAVLAALACFDTVWTHPDPARRRRAFWLACGAAGVGALAKGPIALADVGLPALAWFLLAPRPPVAPRPPGLPWPVLARALAAALACCAAALAPVLLWALAAIARAPELRGPLLFGQHLGRLSGGEAPHAGPPWQHLAEMPLWLLPWTPAVAAGLWGGARAWRAARRSATGGPAALDAGLLRCLLWFGALFLFFSLIPSKRDLYLLPAYPAAALAAARAISGGARLAAWMRWTSVTLLALAGAAFAWLAPLARAYAPRQPSEWRAEAAILVALACAAGALVLALVRWRSSVRLTIGVAISFAALHSLAAVAVFPALNELKSARVLAAVIAARPERPSAIPCFGVQPEGYRFYAGVPTVRGGHDALEPALEREGGEFLALFEGDDWNALDPALRARLAVLEMRGPSPAEPGLPPPSDAVLLVGRAR